MKHWLFGLTVLCAVLCMPPVHAAATSAPVHAQFDAGRAAFQAGDYPGALQRFLDARRDGMNTPALHYNLGVTYYRLQRYDEAEHEFRALLGDPASAPLADYNLGLIALRRGQPDQARRLFATARDTAASPQLRNLADSALARMRTAADAARVQGIVTLSGGYDDNVALTPEADLIGASHKGDAFADLLAAVRMQLSGTRADGVRAEAGAYLRAYRNVNGYDQQAGHLGIARTLPIGAWAGLAGLAMDTVYLDGDRFQTLATLTVQTTRSLSGQQQLLLRYRISRIDGGSSYEQLTGWRQRLGAQLTLPWQGAQAVFGYELESNDRKDLSSGGEFFSQSPLRNTVYTELQAPVAARWRITAHGEYRRSDYRGTDVRLTPAQSATRVDEQWLGALQADYRIDPQWQAFVRYTHTNNAANFAESAYRRNEALAGVELTF